jgi:light-regulated signal transduction histidine kinase (bacteriophytochrome)
MTDKDAQRIAALEAELASLRVEMQDFSYTVSHDLRASLRHISAYAQLVQEDAGPLLTEETRGFLHTISDSARHMGVLMDGLMELAKLGTAEMHIAPLPLLPLVQDVVSELRLEYPQRQIEWSLPTALPSVLADASMLRRALQAVLDNAVKFTANQPNAHISILTEPSHKNEAVDADLPAQDTVVLTVQDNGAGFNPDFGTKLFHPFARLHTTKQFAGIGMGLALTHKIIERLHGKVRANGVVEGGCIVVLTLPADCSNQRPG